ncbi:acetoacetate--CoA ligase [Alphaproteobacteria bacterium]|nr:acetoacetate--CoA ligase [Alphaproteobacteria bacterium]
MTKLYQPSLKKIDSTNLYKFQNAVEKKFNKKFNNYRKFWQWSNSHSDQFWSFLIEHFDIPLTKKKTFKVLNPKSDFWRTVFFDKSLVNYYQLIFNNVSQDLAIHFVGENEFEEKLTYKNLNDRVNSLSNYFKSLDIKKGDVIAGYLPNIPDTIISFLAAAKIGAVWSSCSSDFGMKAVVDRFSQLNPKILIIGDYYFYNGKKFEYSKNLSQLKRKLNNPIVIKTGYPSSNPKSQLSKIYSNKRYQVNSAPDQVEFNHPLYVLYSSGTTGLPKCITHGHGGSLIQHIKELSLHTNVKVKTKMFFLTTCGWMMWNWTVSNLLLGSCIVLYDGSPFFPNINRIINITKKTKATMLGAGAKIYEAIQNNYKGTIKNRLKNIECFISTGSPLSPETFKFINKKLNSKAFIHSVSGGTDIVSCFMLGVPTLPVFAGEIQGPGLGMNIDVLNDRGKPTNKTGELVCKNPFPSKPIYFWNDKKFKKYKAAYFEKFTNIWSHGDYVQKTKNGGYIIYGRSDATLNPGGVRIGTGEIYNSLQKFNWITDCLATGYLIDNDEKVILFIKSSQKLPNKYDLMIKKHLKSTLSPRHVPWKIFNVTDIPRTKSGKNSEILVKKIINNDKVQNLGAIANPEVIKEYKELKINE